VDLCLFDSPDATSPSESVTLPEHTDMVWHASDHDIETNQRLALRVTH
jgi:hypothetical protein